MSSSISRKEWREDRASVHPWNREDGVLGDLIQPLSPPLITQTLVAEAE